MRRRRLNAQATSLQYASSKYLQYTVDSSPETRAMCFKLGRFDAFKVWGVLVRSKYSHRSVLNVWYTLPCDIGPRCIESLWYTLYMVHDYGISLKWGGLPILQLYTWSCNMDMHGVTFITCRAIGVNRFLCEQISMIKLVHSNDKINTSFDYGQ